MKNGHNEDDTFHTTNVTECFKDILKVLGDFKNKQYVNVCIL